MIIEFSYEYVVSRVWCGFYVGELPSLVGNLFAVIVRIIRTAWPFREHAYGLDFIMIIMVDKGLRYNFSSIMSLEGFFNLRAWG